MVTHNDTKWITKFTISITSNSNRVFANGRNQLEISISVTPKTGQTITQEQLDSIRLVTLDDNGSYQALSGQLKASTERDTRFEYYQDTGTPSSRLQLESAPLRKRFYVSSTRSGGSLDTLYAAVNKDEGTQYVSHTSHFNSFAVVESVSPPRMRRDEFDFSAVDERGGEVDREKIDFDLYYLSFKNPRLRVVDLIEYDDEKDTVYYRGSRTIYQGGASPMGTIPSIIDNYYHSACALGPQREITYKNQSITVNQRPGTLTFVRLKITTYRRKSSNRDTPSRWGLLDQYGNEQKIEMLKESNGNLINFKMHN